MHAPLSPYIASAGQPVPSKRADNPDAACRCHTGELDRDSLPQSLRQALEVRPRTGERILHRDRGKQFGSCTFRRIFQEAGIQQSLSAHADPHHSARSDSCIGTLRKEMLRNRCLKTHRRPMRSSLPAPISVENAHSRRTLPPTNLNLRTPTCTNQLVIQISVAPPPAIGSPSP